MTGRRIFIGDLQGCREEFEALLTKVGLRPRRGHPPSRRRPREPGSRLRGVRPACAATSGARPVLGQPRRPTCSGSGTTPPGGVAGPPWRPSRGSRTVKSCSAGSSNSRWCSAGTMWSASTPGSTPPGADPVRHLEGRELLDAEDEDVEFRAARPATATPPAPSPQSDWPPPGDPFRPWDHFWRAPHRGDPDGRLRALGQARPRGAGAHPRPGPPAASTAGSSRRGSPRRTASTA